MKLEISVGGVPISDRLEKAIADRKVIQHEDGTYEIAAERAPDYDFVRVRSNPDCHFLKGFIFRQAFGEAAIPAGCLACYKVKVAPRTLRELVAAWQVAQKFDCSSKWGVDLYNKLSQDIYAGYFYLPSLDAARALYKLVRAEFDCNPKLGSGVPMRIKRGCSEYEEQIGPSDQWQTTPEMVEFEAYLRERFRNKPKQRVPPSVVIGRWVDLAFRIGDDTYTDFTGGKRLHKKSVTYEP